MNLTSRAALAFGWITTTAPALAATLLPPPVVPAQREAISAQGKDVKATLVVDRLKLAVMQGDEMGASSSGWFCGNRQPMVVTENFLKNYGSYAAAIATQELKRLGYPLAGRGNANAYETDIAAAPDFRIGGILTEARHELCSADDRAEGWVHYRIDWALFSERQQKVVYQASADGLAVSRAKVADLDRRALRASLDNFLSSPAILEALKAPDGVVPPRGSNGATASHAAPTEAPPALAPNLTLRSPPSLAGGTLKNQAQLRNAVVTVETANGSGSGFFIDKTGYLLTNAHVISGSKYARVRLQNGDKAVAEVLKINERTDVALLRASAAGIDALGVRGPALDVGADVFAIGSPLGVLNHSITRGVLSADRVLQGRRMLQSDAAVTFGSSGGPLLDGDGKVIGITRGGVEAGKGFNFFIPIDEALKVLDISFMP